MAQTRRSTARGLEQVPKSPLSAARRRGGASAAARRGKRRGRIKYRIFHPCPWPDTTMLLFDPCAACRGLVMMFSASYAYAYYFITTETAYYFHSPSGYVRPWSALC